MGPASWRAMRAVTGGNRTSSSRCTTCRCWSNDRVPSTMPGPCGSGAKTGPRATRPLLRVLREQWPEGGRGVQEFVRVLRLHEQYPAHLVQQAVEQALTYGCPHLDGVLHCLHQLSDDQPVVPGMDLCDHPHLQAVGTQPIDLHQYEQLLSSSG